MSIRQMFQGSIVQPGLNPLVAPTSATYKDLYSWGTNSTGKVGNSSTSDVSSPVQIGTLGTWASLNNGSNGNTHTGAIKTNGTLWMWGSGSGGRLGLGNTTSYSSPKQVGALTNWLQISTGYNFSTAVKTDGTLWSWGTNNAGQLGQGNTTSYSSPKQIGALTTWAFVSAGVFAQGAVKTDGTLWMWGGGQGAAVLGLGNATYYSSPKQVGALTNWLKVYVGQYASFAVKTNGTLWSWGTNNYGQLGLNNNTSYSSPKQIGALTTWLKGAANGYAAAGFIKTDNTLWMWGRGVGGVLGFGNETNYSSPKQVGSLTNWSDVKMSYGGAGTFSLKTDGTLWTWGAGEGGCLGLGNATLYSSPKQVGSSTNWTAIGNARSTVQAISNTTTTPAYTQYSGIWTMQQVNAAVAAGTWPVVYLPITSNGGLWSWGGSDGATSGATGLGNTNVYSSPKQVGSLTTWNSVSTVGWYSLGIKSDRTLWSWGYNADGELGLGNVTNYSSPKQIGSLTNWNSITAGFFTALAIKADGTLWSWGDGAGTGMTGLGNATNYSSPKQVGALTNWSKVNAGRYHVMAIKTDGTLWGWGQNNKGQLGLGNITHYSSPKQVGALTSWLSVAACYEHTLAVKTDGTLWSWGNNNKGQLGLNNTTSYSSPKQVGSLTTWSLTLGFPNGHSSAVIKTDGTLWTWGNNTSGQLGLGDSGNYSSRSSPTQVGLLTNWSKGSTQSDWMTAIKTDGTLWAWGNNSVGQLGLGNRTSYSSPKQVGSLTTWTVTASGQNVNLALHT